MNEKRVLDCHLDLKSSEKGYFEGYASTWGNVDSYGDIMQRGCFGDKISGRDVKMFVDHSYDFESNIGVWQEFRIDKRGLYVRGKLSLHNKKAKKIYKAMKDGSINKMSVGFYVEDHKYKTVGNSRYRVVTKARLYEVSIVSLPANSKANILNVKSSDGSPQWDKKVFHTNLKSMGFTNREADYILDYGFKAFLDMKRLLMANDISDVADAPEKSVPVEVVSRKEVQTEDLNDVLNDFKKSLVNFS